MKSSTGNVQAVKYRATKDKSDGKPKVVYMLTTEGPASMAPSGKSDKDGNPIVKPACVNSYNLNMGGVDMTDQQLHSVSLVRKAYWVRKGKENLQVVLENCITFVYAMRAVGA